MYRILLLSEATLADHDAARIAQLHGVDDVEVHLLVPADAEHNRLIEALDEVALGRLRDALDDDDPTPQEAEQDAMHAVNASLAKLTAAGLTAHGVGDRLGPGAPRRSRRSGSTTRTRSSWSPRRTSWRPGCTATGRPACATRCSCRSCTSSPAPTGARLRQDPDIPSGTSRRPQSPEQVSSMRPTRSLLAH